MKFHSKMSKINYRRQVLIFKIPGEPGRNGQKVDEKKVVSRSVSKTKSCPDLSTVNLHNNSLGASPPLDSSTRPVTTVTQSQTAT